ncbi:hypothetical protein Hypma_014263 [Hypsizygus marmoreus]|uniref:Uncharacterized protein n=1 Tax=Hypsizygus marmoreus TaxID=39966 RepID=A0A369JAK6_HYPMA|nr:hypothetical protein Hypma_014263 [Hypsizygus marmoreus]
MEQSQLSSNADARFHHRIEFEAGTSNSIILSESETIAARLLLSNAERDFQALELQFVAPSHQRAQDAAQLQRLRAAVAPHKRLPTELLSYIFHLSTEDEFFNIPLGPEPTPPWTLRHVCSRWRNIVLDDRNFWSSIAVNLERGEGPGYKEIGDITKSTRLLDMVISKTGPIVMSLRIDGYFMRVQEAIERIIVPHASRMVDLDIGLPGDSMVVFYDMLPDDLGVLQNLILDFVGPTSADPPISGFPSTLRNLTILGGYDVLYLLPTERANWQHLIDLEFSHLYVKLSDMFSILEYCASLETCDIAVWECDCGTSEHSIILPHLRFFIVRLDHGAFFDAFTLPSLYRLYVQFEESFPATEITSMIQRSGCALKKLDYYEAEGRVGECGPNALANLFAATPSLQSLCAQTLMTPKPILERMGSNDLLPQLEEFETCLDAETLDMFFDVVEHRLRDIPSDASRSRLVSALGIYPENFSLEGDNQRFVVRAANLSKDYQSDVRIEPFL